MEIPINKRIIELIESLELNTNQFADLLGLSRPDKIYNVVNYKNKVSTDILELISIKIKNINSEWLLTGNHPMFKKENPETNTIIIEQKNEDFEIIRKERDTLKDKLLIQHERYQALLEKYNQLEEALKKKQA